MISISKRLIKNIEKYKVEIVFGFLLKVLFFWSLKSIRWVPKVVIHWILLRLSLIIRSRSLKCHVLNRELLEGLLLFILIVIYRILRLLNGFLELPTLLRFLLLHINWMLNLLNILNLRYHLLRLNELDLLNHRNSKNKPLSTFPPHWKNKTLERIKLYFQLFFIVW